MKRIDILFLSVLSVLLLTSCSKYIEGKIVDNFGNPISDVNISIKGTQFAATSNSAGIFKLDYAPGDFIIQFESTNHVSEEKKINISEKQKYPLETIELVRNPSGKGLYITTPQISDYIEVPKIKLATRKSSDDSFMSAGMIKRDLILNESDSVFVIKVKSLDNIKVFDWSGSSWMLGTENKDGGFATVTWDIAYEYATLLKPINEKIFRHLTGSFQIREAVWEYDKVYAFLNMKKSTIANKIGTYSSYVFKFEKE